MVGDGGTPCGVGDAGEGEDGEVADENGEDGYLEAGGVAKEGESGVREETGTGRGSYGVSKACEG